MHRLQRRAGLVGLLSLAAPDLPALEGPRLEVPLLMGDAVPLPVWQAFLDLLGREARLRWRVQPLPWSRALEAARQGKGVLFGVGRSQERERFLAFSLAFSEQRVWLVQRQEDARAIKRLEDLEALSVCMLRSPRYSDRLDAVFARMTRKQHSDAGIPGVFRMLRAKRCDVGVVSVRGSHLAESLAVIRMRGFDLQGLVLREPALEQIPLHFAAARGSPWEPAIARLDVVLRQRRAELQTLIRPDGPAR